MIKFHNSSVKTWATPHRNESFSLKSIQISLHICTVWSESLLVRRGITRSSAIHNTPSKDWSDYGCIGWSWRLICQNANFWLDQPVCLKRLYDFPLLEGPRNLPDCFNFFLFSNKHIPYLRKKNILRWKKK